MPHAHYTPLLGHNSRQIVRIPLRAEHFACCPATTAIKNAQVDEPIPSRLIRNKCLIWSARSALKLRELRGRHALGSIKETWPLNLIAILSAIPTNFRVWRDLRKVSDFYLMNVSSMNKIWKINLHTICTLYLTYISIYGNGGYSIMRAAILYVPCEFWNLPFCLNTLDY